MKKYLAKMLRRAAQKLDPQFTKAWVCVSPSQFNATASTVTLDWRQNEIA